MQAERRKLLEAYLKLPDTPPAQLCEQLDLDPPLAAATSQIKDYIAEQLKQHISDNVLARKFELQGAQPDLCSRFQLITALEDLFTDTSQPMPFPSDSLSQSCHYLAGKLKPAVTTADKLVETVLKWLQAATKTDLFKQEELFIASLELQDSTAVLSFLPEKQTYYQTLPSTTSSLVSKSTVDFDFYRRMVAAGQIDKEVLTRRLKEDLRENFQRRKQTYLERQLATSQDHFLTNTLKEMKKTRKEQGRKQLFKGLWDHRRAAKKTSDFKVIAYYQKLLEHDASIRQLLDLLGRTSKEDISLVKEIQHRTVTDLIPYEKPTSKGQISGIGQSNDLSSLIPTELLYRCSPATKKLFDKRLLEKQLLSFRYQNTLFIERKHTITEEVTVAKAKKRGPIMLLVDTSGSMVGTAETISKMITLALAKLALQAQRSCYLIFYSVDITQLELDHYDPIRLAAFLRQTFEGGTDLNPALEEVMDKLEEEKWSSADVLVISDFLMDDLVSRLKAKMAAQKEKGTRFYSLCIGEKWNPEVLSSFDAHWYYDPTLQKVVAQQGKREQAQATIEKVSDAWAHVKL